MKSYILLAICLVVSIGHGQEANSQSDILRRLETVEKELKKVQAPVRWATADKSKITTAIFVWSQEKLVESRAAEALSPEVEAKVNEYEKLRNALMLKGGRIRSIPTRPIRLTPGAASPSPQPQVALPQTEAEKDIEALTKRVAEAKVPVADIIERRESLAAQLRAKYTVEALTAEYAKDRYEVVVDSREPVLFKSTEFVADITEGVLALLKEKTK
jgi:hypothetical protein